MQIDLQMSGINMAGIKADTNLIYMYLQYLQMLRNSGCQIQMCI